MLGARIVSSGELLGESWGLGGEREEGSTGGEGLDMRRVLGKWQG